MTRSHHDSATLSIKNWDTTESGALRCFGTVAKTGELVYLNSDSSKRIEVVEPSVLFESEHLDSLGLLPVCLTHPDQQVDLKNFRQFVVGSTGDRVFINRSKGTVSVALSIHEDAAIAAVKAGTKELSLGYYAQTEPLGDGRYRQTLRRANHLSIVQRARAGKEARLHYA